MLISGKSISKLLKRSVMALSCDDPVDKMSNMGKEAYRMLSDVTYEIVKTTDVVGEQLVIKPTGNSRLRGLVGVGNEDTSNNWVIEGWLLIDDKSDDCAWEKLMFTEYDITLLDELALRIRLTYLKVQRERALKVVKEQQPATQYERYTAKGV